jgi:hypothetical protein
VRAIASPQPPVRVHPITSTPQPLWPTTLPAVPCLQASTKQLLLDTLASSCSNIHKPGNISALWTPASRVWAAMQACTSGGSALQNSYLGTGLAGGAAARGSTTAGTRTMTTMVV